MPRPQRPLPRRQRALSAAEEGYATALWPIHREVKLAALGMSFAGIAYKTNGQDPNRLEAEVKPLGESFRAAIAKAQGLEVPESMREVHARYLEALALYENASEEMVEAARDGRDDRLIEAQGMSFRASENAAQGRRCPVAGRVQATLRRSRRQMAAAFGWQQRLRSNGEDQLMNKLVGALATVGLTAAVNVGGALAQAETECSVWLVESSRFMNVPFGAFMPDRAFVPGSTNANNNINTVDLPVNIGVIKCGEELILYDSGWKQQEYHQMTGTDHWVALPEQLELLDFSADQVTKIVIGHGHWDHAGQLSDFPNAVLYVQREELQRDRVGAQLSQSQDQRDQHRSGRLHAHAGLRLHAARRWTRSTARSWPARR